MDMTTTRYRLLIACPDRPGIIAAVSNLLARKGCNIIGFDQYSEGLDGGVFFIRDAVKLRPSGRRYKALPSGKSFS